MKINGVTVRDPSYGGVEETTESIWSSDTGRNTKGKMIGDLIAIKKTIKCTWKLLSYQEFYTIRNAIMSGMSSGGFFSIEYPDTTSTGSPTTTTKTVYAGNVPATLASTNAKFQKYTDVSVTFIEQ